MADARSTDCVQPVDLPQRASESVGTAAPQDQELTSVRAWLAESPKSNKEYAKWVLRAVELGFAAWSDPLNRTEGQLKDLSEDKKVQAADPTQAQLLPSLDILHAVLAGSARRWLRTEGSRKPSERAAKASLGLGSYLRSGGGKHQTGAAIDLNNLDFSGSAARVMEVIADLPPGRWDIGLPFQGDFFPPEKEYAAQIREQEKKLPQAQPGPASDIGSVATATATAPSVAAAAPPVIEIHDGLEKFVTTVYEATYNHATRQWEKRPTRGTQAVTLLKSQALKDKLAELRSQDSRYEFIVFPDNKEHIHLAKT